MAGVKSEMYGSLAMTKTGGRSWIIQFYFNGKKHGGGRSGKYKGGTYDTLEKAGRALAMVPVTPGTHDLPKVTAEDLAAIAGITQKTLLDSLTTVIIPQAKGLLVAPVSSSCLHALADGEPTAAEGGVAQVGGDPGMAGAPSKGGAAQDAPGTDDADLDAVWGDLGADTAGAPCVGGAAQDCPGTDDADLDAMWGDVGVDTAGAPCVGGAAHALPTGDVSAEVPRGWRTPHDPTSDYNGVKFCAQSQKWCARVWWRGKDVWLGNFTIEEEAARKVDNFLLSKNKDAATNFPRSQYNRGGHKAGDQFGASAAGAGERGAVLPPSKKARILREVSVNMTTAGEGTTRQAGSAKETLLGAATSGPSGLSAGQLPLCSSKKQSVRTE